MRAVVAGPRRNGSARRSSNRNNGAMAYTAICSEAAALKTSFVAITGTSSLRRPGVRSVVHLRLCLEIGVGTGIERFAIKERGERAIGHDGEAQETIVFEHDQLGMVAQNLDDGARIEAAGLRGTEIPVQNLVDEAFGVETYRKQVSPLIASHHHAVEHLRLPRIPRQHFRWPILRVVRR